MVRTINSAGDIMQTEFKHINFEEVDNKPKKTRVFVIANNSSGEEIGEIKWLCAWRQYCFFPEANCVFSRSCLLDIELFIQQLMDERKKRTW